MHHSGLGLGGPSESGNGNNIHLHVLLYQINTSTICLLLLRPPRNARQRARFGRYVIPPPFLSTNALILCKKNQANASTVAIRCPAQCATSVHGGGSPPTSPYPLHCAPIPSGIGQRSTPLVHQRHRPYPSRLHQWTIRAPNDRRARTPRAEPKVRRFLLSRPSLRLLGLNLPSLTASTAPSPSPPCHLHPRVDFPACRVSTHAPRLQQPLSPIQ
jgi:hypothetical protein